jgi:hypothetical protein
LRGLASPFTRHPPAGGLITRRWTSHSRTCGRNHRSLQKKAIPTGGSVSLELGVLRFSPFNTTIQPMSHTRRAGNGG